METSADALPTAPANLAVLGLLRDAPATLYAVLDAARDGWILSRLLTATEEHQSLYEGAAAESMAPYAPYLVRLPAESPLLELIVAEGWGKSWGMFLSSPADFAEVRRHLRRFLLVRHEDGRELYFRFYDPRVLRTFLPACSFDEVREFFGPLGCFLLEAGEGEGAGLVEFSLGPRRLEARRALEEA